ncbi:MAG: hypothetical protein K0S26_682 [Bacteroidota bacterium]|jgi:hypothetical protein|nr:hypothetical protein [Bacteroidota bacterium]
MKKSICLSLFFSCIILASCRKEPQPVSPSVPDNTEDPVTPGYDGEVYTFKEVYLDNAGWPVYNVHSAIFYATTVTSPSVTLASVNAGTVNINGTVLKKSTSLVGPYYIDTTNSVSSTNYLIYVSGSSQFPAGTLQYGQNYPTFNDTALIPPTVQLSTGLSIQFNNCLNTDSVFFSIDDNNGGIVEKKYAVANNQVHLTISPAELSTFTQTSNGIIRVDVAKMTTTPVGAKKYLVTLEKRYNKLNVQFN